MATTFLGVLLGFVWNVLLFVVGSVLFVFIFIRNNLIAIFVLGPLVTGVFVGAHGLIPVAASTESIFSSVANVVTGIQNAVNPIFDDIRQIVQCTITPVYKIYNSLARVVLATVRVAIILGAGCDPDDPQACSETAFAWAWRAERGARLFGELERARKQLNAMRETRAGRGDAWKKHSEYVRHASPPRSRQQARDIPEFFCNIVESASEFLLDTIDILSTYYGEFLTFFASFYENLVFTASYIEILVQWLVIFLVGEIPIFKCLIDVNNFDPTDVTSYLPSATAVGGCVCPHVYSGAPFPYFGPTAPWISGPKQPAPSNVAVMLVGCVCPLNGGTDIISLFFSCTRLQAIINWFQNTISDIQNRIQPFVNFVQSSINQVRNLISGLEGRVAELRNILNGILDRIRSLRRREIEMKRRMRARNATRTYENGTIARDEFEDDLDFDLELDAMVQDHYEMHSMLSVPDTPIITPEMQHLIDAQAAEIMRQHFDIQKLLTARAQVPVHHEDARAFSLPEVLRDERYVPRNAGSGPAANALDGLIRRLSIHVGVRAVRADLGEQAADDAALMERGAGCVLTTLRQALGGNMTVQQIVDGWLSPCVLEGGRAHQRLFAAMREKHPPTATSERVRTAVRAARTAMFKPGALGPLVRHMRATGRNATAIDAGLEDAVHVADLRPLFGDVRELDVMMAHARRELHAIRAEMREIKTTHLKEMTARDATIQVSVGITGAGFIFSLLSEGIGSFGGAVITAAATVIGTVAAALASLIPVALSAVFHLAGGFFENLSRAENGQPLRFDGGISVITSRSVGLIGQSYTVGYTEAMLQQYANEIADDIAATAEYIGIRAIGKALNMRDPFVDDDGKLTEEPGDYFYDAGPNAPVDEPCIRDSDCDNYPCRLSSDITVQCDPTTDDQCARGICAIDTCATNADCASGVKCLGPVPDYDTECITTGDCPGGGACANYCGTELDCIALGGGICASLEDPGNFCTFLTGLYPNARECRFGTCVAWPLLAPPAVPIAKFDAVVVPDCAALGLTTLDDLRYWEWSAQFAETGLSAETFFSWDYVRFVGRCYVSGYYVARLTAGIVLNGWHVAWQSVFLTTVGSSFFFVPPGLLAGAMKIGLAGNYLTDALLWTRDAAGAVGGFLESWPWIIGDFGSDLVWISEFRPNGHEFVCVGAAVAPLGVAASWTLLLFLGLSILLSAGLLGLGWLALKIVVGTPFQLIRLAVRASRKGPAALPAKSPYLLPFSAPLEMRVQAALGTQPSAAEIIAKKIN